MKEVRAAYEIDLLRHAAAFRRVWWKVALLSLAAGGITLVATFLLPNRYQATADIAPAVEEGKQSPAGGLGGVLASIGISLEGPSKVEDLESLFKSRELTVRVFRKHNLWPILRPKDFDPETATLRPDWNERLFGGTGEARQPGDWDAVRGAQERMTVTVNRKAGTLSLTFESPSPQGSADIVRYYLEEGKSRLQEEALQRAVKNKKFIEEQIARTADPLTRTRLFSLYGQEVEREMMARNREQFGFKIIDGPMAPDRKSSPYRAKAALFATLVSLPLWGLILVVRSERKGYS